MQTLKYIIYSSLLAIILNYTTYYSFTTNYTRFVFSEEGFANQYHSSIYKFRFLSQHFLDYIYNLIKQEDITEERLKLLDENATNSFYYSYFILNTFFSILCSITLVFILNNKLIHIKDRYKLLLISSILLIINLTQYVIVPYDISAYFFLLLFLLFSLKFLEKEKIIHLISMSLIVFISTLNRETAALCISLLLSLLLFRNGLSKKTIFPVLYMIISYLIAYVGIRIYFGNSIVFSSYSNTISSLIYFKNILGSLFWFLLFYLTISIADNLKNKVLIMFFHLFSLPYIISCFLTGILYEIRLYIPLFLVSIIFSIIDMNKISIKTYESKEYN